MKKYERVKMLNNNASENERLYREGRISQETYLTRKKDVKNALAELASKKS